jgi:vesicle coat complex subunit
MQIPTWQSWSSGKPSHPFDFIADKVIIRLDKVKGSLAYLKNITFDYSFTNQDLPLFDKKKKKTRWETDKKQTVQKIVSSIDLGY